MTPLRRISLLALAALALALAAPAAAADATLKRQLAGALAGGGANTSALAIDLRTGELVYAQNAWLGLAPASNEKLAVSYAALVALGPDFRIETDVVGQGVLTGTTWRGDLILVGHGDPSLSGAGGAPRSRGLVQQLDRRSL